MIKKVLLVLVVVFIGIQFIPLEKNNAVTPEVVVFEAETKPSKGVQTILEAKCYDCHSNKTNYPWYANIAPVSFFIHHHVEEGKEHLDFSNWGNYMTKKKEHKLEELIEEVEEEEMPLTSYELLHGGLNASETKKIVDWAKEILLNY